MTSRSFFNYLRTHRRRLGLSQDEVAFLLGCKCGSKFSRYETASRHPGLATLFACQIIFKVELKDLFPELFREVEKKTGKLARTLAGRLCSGKFDKATTRKLESLKKLGSQFTDEIREA